MEIYGTVAVFEDCQGNLWDLFSRASRIGVLIEYWALPVEFTNARGVVDRAFDIDAI